MPRSSTIARVHEAVLALAAERGPTALTMEGIAARAGVGKQTLYRSWRSVPELLFDALLAREDHRPEDPIDVGAAGSGLDERVVSLLWEAAREIGTEPHASLLRALAAVIQTDEAVARAYHDRLLEPQLAAVRAMLADGGAADPVRAAELLLAPVFYRWFMRLPAMTRGELTRHVHDVLALTGRRD